MNSIETLSGKFKLSFSENKIKYAEKLNSFIDESTTTYK